jgi:dephospho-CoA kinase
VRIIGLTGGIATGKSTFAAALRALGAPVVDADRLARAAVAKGTPGLGAVVAAFGAEMLGPDGELDRPRMAARVFGDPGARARLEAIVHPEVRRLFRAELARLAAEASEKDAMLVTTEKDWVRIAPAWRQRASALKVEVEWADEAALRRVLAPAMERAHG